MFVHVLTRRSVVAALAASALPLRLPAQTAPRLQSWKLATSRRTGIHDVAPAPDGGVWFTAQASGHLGWFEPASGRTELIALGAGSSPHGVIQGPDGAAWITVLSSFQMAAQTALPPWVRARGLALYIMALSLATAIGSLAWGAIAQHGSMALSLWSAGAVAVVLALVSMRWRLGPAETLDVMPSAHWPEPVFADAPPAISTPAPTLPTEPVPAAFVPM